MKLGGYQVLDFWDVTITTTAVKMDGLYALIDKGRKAFLITGLKIGTEERRKDFWLPSLPVKSGTGTSLKYTLTIDAATTIEVTVNDNVKKSA